jgi:hypothetical protein
VDRAVVKAYQTTDYVVFDRQREVSIRVGRRSREVDRLLARFGARSAVFITAWNPFSRILTDGQNEHRQRWAPKPTRPGDTLQVESEVVAVRPSRSRPGRGTATVRSLTRNQRNEVVQELTAKLIVPRRV